MTIWGNIKGISFFFFCFTYIFCSHIYMRVYDEDICNLHNYLASLYLWHVYRVKNIFWSKEFILYNSMKNNLFLKFLYFSFYIQSFTLETICTYISYNFPSWHSHWVGSTLRSHLISLISSKGLFQFKFQITLPKHLVNASIYYLSSCSQVYYATYYAILMVCLNNNQQVL